MMNTLMYGLETAVYLFAFVLVLSVVVVVHEWGHFIVARLCGVKVVEFSIGFGKKLCSRKDKKGTIWKVCLLPLGGYVKMLGDGDAASAKSSEENIPQKDRKFMFVSQPLYKRAAIIFAGPTMNYVFAFFVLVGVCFCYGRAFVPTTIGEIIQGSPAEAAGLLAGDKILSLNGVHLKEWGDLQRHTRVLQFGQKLDVEFERDGQVLHVQIMPEPVAASDAPYPIIGVRSAPALVERMNLSFVESVHEAGHSIYVMTADTFRYLGQILTKKRSADDMRGPLGIAEASGDALKGGVASLVIFIVNLSVAIGFMNLLPIPILDGGHLFFYAIEAIIRRPIPEKVQNAFLSMGIALLFGLLIFTMYLDIPRIIQRIFE